MKDNHVSDSPAGSWRISQSPVAFLSLAVALAVILGIAAGSVRSTSAQVNTCGNGMLDPGEDCELSPPRPFCPPGAVCNSSCDCAFVATTTTPTTTVAPTTTTLVDHFQCYEVKPADFPAVSVTVQDQFGTLLESLRFPTRLAGWGTA